MGSPVELDVSEVSQTGCLRLTLNRPDRRNALTRQMLEEMSGLLQEVHDRSDARVLQFCSTGPAFCAGMDLAEMQERAEAPDRESQWQQDSEIYCEVLEKLFTLPVPVIARIQGPVLAGGMGLVLASDLLVASESTFFALPEPMRGITAAMVTPYLVFRVGAGVATQWLLSGERVSAQRAAQAGLCLETVPDIELVKRTEMLTRQVLGGSMSALAITKRHLHECADAGAVLESARKSISVSAIARQTEDAREGLAAFLEKRKPNWMPT